MPQELQEAEYYEVKNKGGFSPFRTIVKLIFKVVFSPFIVLVIAYLYFKDTRKAFLVALLFYSSLTALSILWSFFQMFLAMATFNLFKFLKKSIKIILMIIALIVYWGAYILMWGTNFSI